MDKIQEAYIKALKDYIETEGISVRELASRTNIARSTLHRILRGYQRPYGVTVARLGDLLDIRVDIQFGPRKEPLQVLSRGAK